MKLKNFLSLFMCIVMVFSVAQSVMILSANKQLKSPSASISTYVCKTSGNSTVTNHRTAFSWRHLFHGIMIFLTVVTAALFTGAIIYFDCCDKDVDIYSANINNNNTVAAPLLSSVETPDASFIAD